MSDPSLQTPDDYRRRYFELKARAEEAAKRRPPASMTSNPRELPLDEIVLEETIPPGWYWTGPVARGLTLRIVNTEGAHGVSALFWNARDTSERFNPADTVKVQWSARLARGRLLLSDMGRVLASITDDTCGYHDFVAGGSSAPNDERKFGASPGRRNTRDNFLLAAGKHGLGPRDVGPCVTFFAPVLTDKEGRLGWKQDAVRSGDYIDLRAEMDLLVALSNCPHPLSPARAWHASPVSLTLWRSPAPHARDFCRTATDEAARAFENTDAYLRATGGAQ